MGVQAAESESFMGKPDFSTGRRSSAGWGVFEVKNQSNLGQIGQLLAGETKDDHLRVGIGVPKAASEKANSGESDTAGDAKYEKKAG